MSHECGFEVNSVGSSSILQSQELNQAVDQALINNFFQSLRIGYNLDDLGIQITLEQVLFEEVEILGHSVLGVDSKVLHRLAKRHQCGCVLYILFNPHL